MSGALYVHVPFCGSKCPYCDFYSKAPRPGEYDSYLHALQAELALRSGEPGGVRPATVYIGGGTPSALPADVLTALLASLPLEAAEEVTVEVNPDDVTPELPDMLARAGVNRLSMGVQSLDDSLLRRLRRRHDRSGAIRALEAIAASPIAEYSIDLMYGLPEQTPGMWRRTLAEALAMRPPHLSAYLLSYEPGTRFTAMQAAGKLPPQSEELAQEMYDILCRETRAAGYLHYEISNFCLPGHHSRHNSSYWDFTPYLGLGPAAHSFDGVALRSANPASLKEWTDALAAGRNPAVTEREDADTLHNDRVITALRTARGLRCDVAEASEVRRLAAGHLATGALTEPSPGLFVIPEERWLTADYVLADLMRV